MILPPTAHNKAFWPSKKESASVGSDPAVQRARAESGTSSNASPRSSSPFSSYAAGFGAGAGGVMTPQSPLAGSGGFGASYAAGAQQFQATVDVLKADHLKAARSSVRDPELLRELEGEIERDCEGLRSFLFAAQVWWFYYYRCCWIYTLVDWIRS